MNTLNKDFASFRYACEEAPEGTYLQAKDIRRLIGDLADALIRKGRDLGLEVDTCDGIHNVEATMFDMLRQKNPDSQIEQAIGFGRTITDFPEQKERIIAGLVRDRDFLLSLVTA